MRTLQSDTEPVVEHDSPSPQRIGFPDFSWSRVPLNIHFGKRSGDLSDEEIAFVAAHSDLICLEKGNGTAEHGGVPPFSWQEASEYSLKILSNDT